MPALAGWLFLPLLGGFCFLYFCNRTRFWYRPLDGHRLLLSTALCGAILFTLSRLLTLLFASTGPGEFLRSCLKQVLAFDFSGASVGSLVLGAALAWILSLKPTESFRLSNPISWVKSLGSNATDELMKRARRTDELLALVIEARNKRLAVLLTLENRKAYAGYFLQVPLELEAEFLTLLPTASGYRDSDTLELELTTTYRKTLEIIHKAASKKQELSEDDLEKLFESQIIILRTKVISAVIWDQELYASHQAERALKASEPASAPPSAEGPANHPATEDPTPVVKPAKKARRTSKSNP
ncbi:MAG: hypothetical protein SF066_08270 [Thermoanaerobaculia bacterium]|nr:hypothetical protein [Thermoanaerobaculia bacterium]